LEASAVITDFHGAPLFGFAKVVAKGQAFAGYFCKQKSQAISE
jgi:hypothetical protein